jgi:hypothetical protein
VRCWGYGYVGQQVIAGITDAVQVGAGRSGGGHECALRATGAIFCWGYDAYGQATPPSGSFTQVSVGALHGCALATDRTVSCWGAGTAAAVTHPHYAQALVPPGLTDVVQVSAGSTHTCARRADGSVVCWGYDSDGQVSGTPNTLTTVSVASHPGPYVEVAAGLSHTCARNPDGTVQCWGDDYYGESSPPALSFTQLSAGGSNSCGVRPDGTIVCWGRNVRGESTPPFPFAGFFAPVENPGPTETVVNVAKAGAGIAVRFSLGGNQGLAIFRAGYPKFTYTACAAGGTDDPVDATTSSPGGLSFSETTGQYTYVWRTERAWAGACGRFDLGLVDRSDHHALFRFTR